MERSSKQVGWVERERNPSSIAGLDDFIASSASPIFGIGTEPDPATKRGIRPVPHADGVAVFHRIEVNVVEVPRRILLVAQGVFPIPTLPDPALALGGAAGGAPFASGQSVRKAAFDQAPTQGEIRIVLGQGPDHVQVIRQDHGSLDREGMSCAHLTKHGPQKDDMFGQQHKPPVGQINREEVAAACYEVAPIGRNYLIPAVRVTRWVSLRSTHPTAIMRPA